MLTKEDIEDLKLYTADFNKFCEEHVCGDGCEVFKRSVKDGKSCWKSFTEMKKENAGK